MIQVKLRNYPLAIIEENDKLPEDDPARAIADIITRPNRFLEFGRGGHMLGAWERQELFRVRMLQDSLDRVLFSVVGGDGKARDFQAEGLPMGGVAAPQDQGGVEG